MNLHGQERIDALHNFIISGIEEGLPGFFDIPFNHQAGYIGRQSAPKFVWRQAGGAPSGKHVASSRTAREWRLLQRRLEDIDWGWEQYNPVKLHTALEDASKDLEGIQAGAGNRTVLLGGEPESTTARTSK